MKTELFPRGLGIRVGAVVNGLLAPLGLHVSRRKPKPRSTLDLARVALQDRENAFVIDVGAYMGEFAAYVLQLVPKAHVVCIEPIPVQADLLRRRFEQCNVTVVCCAAGDHDGEVEFHQVSEGYSSSVLLMSRHKTEFPSISVEVASYPVPLRRLDAILDDLSRDHNPVDLLKIDVQGYKLPVLKGAASTLSRCRYLLVEMSLQPLYDGQASFEQVICWLYNRGFRMIDYAEGARSHVTGELLQMDFLYAASCAHEAARDV